MCILLNLVTRYEEIKFINSSIIDNHIFGYSYGHFTEVIWPSINLIGCVRFYTEKPLKDGFKEIDLAFKYSVICNYASTFRNDSLVNESNVPLYKRGEPCTACRENTKCVNGEYPSLCGKIEPVPTDPPFNIPDTATTLRFQFYFLILSIIFVCY